MRKYRVGLALFLILIMLFTCMPIMTQAEKTNTGTIIKDNIFFRSRATTSSGWSRRFKKGDVVEIIGEEGDFYKVTYLKKTGYVMKKFVSLSSGASTTLNKTEPTAAPATAKATATPKVTQAKATATPAAVKAASGTTGTITKDNIFFRSRPTTSSGWSRRFKKGDVVEIIGEDGDFYKVTYLKKTGYVMKKFVSLSSSASSDSSESKTSNQLKTEKLVWFNTGKNLFVSGATFQVKDVNTGKVWNCKRLYAGNHLDAEPLTAADTKIMKEAYGGTFNYVRRPVLVKYNGHVYAGSMYGEPHGDYTIKDNNFDGQFCIHFTGSKTSDSNSVNSDHQAAVEKALKASW